MITRIAKLGKTERTNLADSKLAHKGRRVKIDLTRYEPSENARKQLDYILSMMTFIEASYGTGKKTSYQSNLDEPTTKIVRFFKDLPASFLNGSVSLSFDPRSADLQ